MEKLDFNAIGKRFYDIARKVKKDERMQSTVVQTFMMISNDLGNSCYASKILDEDPVLVEFTNDIAKNMKSLGIGFRLRICKINNVQLNNIERTGIYQCRDATDGMIYVAQVWDESRANILYPLDVVFDDGQGGTAVSTTETNEGNSDLSTNSSMSNNKINFSTP